MARKRAMKWNDLHLRSRVESITDDNVESNCSIIGNIPPKDVSFSDFICIFAMPDEVLFDYYCNTKLSESSDMAKSWAARLCRLPKQELFVAQDIIKVKIYSVAELRLMNKFYISLLFLFMAMTSFAQEQISGIVVGDNSKPIEFATILQLSADSTAIEGTVSDNNGKFKLPKDTNAKLLKVSYIGYQNRIINLPLKKDTIHLSINQEQLQEVLVTARKQLTKRITSGISYDMSQNKRAQSESLLQALRYVPTLDVALNGNVTVKGNSSYRIYVNGRSYDMAQSNPQQVLQSIPAKSIKKVEVITEPSEAFGNSPGEYIINIITDKDALDGIYVNTTLQGNTQPATNDGIMVMAKKKNVDFSAHP